MFLKKTNIFDLFEKQTQIIKTAANDFENVISRINQIEKQVDKYSKLEHEADQYVHEILNQIEKVFILPLDKEDLQSLAMMLDDIMDDIEHVVNLLYIYDIKKSNQTLKKFAKYLNECVLEVCNGVELIKARKQTQQEFVECCTRIIDIENKADVLHREILRELVGKKSVRYARDTISIMKWKEVFDTLEDTIDLVKDVAILFERIRIKYG